LLSPRPGAPAGVAGGLARWALTLVGRSPDRSTHSIACLQCGDWEAVRIVRLGRRRARYWCDRCGAVVSTDERSGVRARADLESAATPAEAAPRDLTSVLPPAMLEWINGWSRRPLTLDRLDRSTVFQLYNGWDAHRARTGDAPSALPAFATVVRALAQSCFHDEAAVARLPSTAEPQALRERVAHARGWVASRGAAECWILREPAGEPDPDLLRRAAEDLRAGVLPDPTVEPAVRTAVFGTDAGPSLRVLGAVYSVSELAAAVSSYLDGGTRPLRDAALARLRTEPGDARPRGSASPSVTSARPDPAGRATSYRVNRSTLAVLLAGRTSYRLIQVAATALLLPAWGAQRYGGYAAAVASLSWLTALALTGPEKTLLKLLPRAPRTGRLVVEAALAVLWWLPLPVAAAFAIALVLGASGAVAIYLGVAAMLLTTGCTLLLIALHRATGRPGADARAFLVMSVAQVAMLAAATSGRLSPVGYVTASIATQSLLNVVLSATLGRPSWRIHERRGLLRGVAWSALLMGGAEVAGYLSVAVLFAFLAASVWADQLGPLFATHVVWSAGVNLLIYVLRVFAPLTSLRLVGSAGRLGRGRAARVAAAAAAYDAGWIALVAVLLARGLDLPTSTYGQVLVFGTLLVSLTPGVAALVWAGYIWENTDARAARVTGGAAVAGVVVGAATGLVAVPAFGGIGVVAALAVVNLVQAAVLARVGWRRRPTSDTPTTPERLPAPGEGIHAAA
jgi:hypothetical protein